MVEVRFGKRQCESLYTKPFREAHMETPGYSHMSATATLGCGDNTLHPLCRGSSSITANGPDAA